VDGLLKAPLTYEPYDPAEIGVRRRLVLGAQSGRASLRAAAAAFDLDITEEELIALVELVRTSAVPSNRHGNRSLDARSHNSSDMPQTAA
jgi:Isopropylmalate/homocitrate/citramalate synthases